MKRLLVSTIFVFAVAAAFAQQPAQPPVTLKLGDLAPPLKFGSQLKGKELPKLGDGKIHVLEFWATWCGPCKASMPGLSELAEKYRGKATFTGVNVWEALEAEGADKQYPACVAKATKFVNRAGSMMDYEVVMDSEDGAMAKNWLSAAGQRGIPSTFVVGGDGHILWIGHPMVGLDQVVELATQGKLDVEGGKKITTDTRAKFNQFYGMITTHGNQIKAGDYAGANKTADDVIALLPDVTDGINMKMTALVHLDRAAARALAEKSAERFPRSPYLLLSLSSELLSDAPGRSDADTKLALRLTKSATKYFGEDTSTLQLLAEAYHKAGNDKAAVEKQQKFIDLISAMSPRVRDSVLPQAKSKLAEYQTPGK